MKKIVTIESVKVELSLTNNLMFDNEYVIKGGIGFLELHNYENLRIKEIGHISSHDSIRVCLNDNAIDVAIFSQYGILMEFRLFINSEESECWHLKRVYSKLEDVKVSLFGSSLLFEFSNINASAHFSYSEGVLTIS